MYYHNSASNLLIFQAVATCVTCHKSVLSDTIIILAKQQRGRVSKNGPIHNNTTVSKLQDIKDAICVFPPVACWIYDRDRDAANGMHEKKLPNIFPEP